MFVDINESTLKEWGISLSGYTDNYKVYHKGYEDGGWGTAVGGFKVYSSIIKRFRKNIFIFLIDDPNNPGSKINRVDSNGNLTIEDNIPATGTTKPGYPNWDNPDYWRQVNIFDAERCFNEVAITYITAVVANYEILRKLKFTWLPKETQNMIRKAVFNAIEYAALNRQFWENVNGSQISGSAFNINVDTTAWLLSTDMFGMKAHNFLTASGLSEIDYYYAGDGFVKKTPKGNYTIIGKADLSKFPEFK